MDINEWFELFAVTLALGSAAALTLSPDTSTMVAGCMLLLGALFYGIGKVNV